MEPLAKSNIGPAVVFEMLIEAHNDPSNQEIIRQVGAELAHNAYEKVVEFLDHTQVQDGLKVLGGIVRSGIR